MPKGHRGYSTLFVRRVAQSDQGSLVTKLANECIAREIPISVIAAEMGVTRATVYSWFTHEAEPRQRHKEKIQTLLARMQRA